jgi:hypothetical protein
MVNAWKAHTYYTHVAGGWGDRNTVSNFHSVPRKHYAVTSMIVYVSIHNGNVLGEYKEHYVVLLL